MATCGWKMRLASTAMCRAIVYLAKVSLLLLPPLHPTKLMLNLSITFPGETWTCSVLDIMSTFPAPIPAIENNDLFASCCLDRVMVDSGLCKVLLRQYKFTMSCLPCHVLIMRSFTWRLVRYCQDYIWDLGAQWLAHSWSSLLPVLEVHEWKDARLWAFIKLTGRWPGSKQLGGRASAASHTCIT